MGAVYLIFGFTYPIYISIVLVNQVEDLGVDTDDTDEVIPVYHEIFTPDESKMVLVPFIVLFSIHICAILPQLLCQFQRKLEFMILSLTIVAFIFEIWRYESNDRDF